MAAAQPDIKPGDTNRRGHPAGASEENEPILQPPSRGWVRRLWRLALTARFLLFQRHRHRRLTIERVAGVPLLVAPDVFNPRLFRTGEALARYVQTQPMPAGTKVLDLGTGSGIGAVFAARQGAQVAATDVSSDAVRCARINALLNGLESRINVLQGDLFEPVRGEHFDLVLFNPPYFPGRPRDAWEHAWRSDDVLARFAEGLPGVLPPTGRALVILSSDAEIPAVTDTLTRAGLRWSVAWQRNLVNERLVILEVTADSRQASAS